MKNGLEQDSTTCIGIKGVPGKNNLALGDARVSNRCRNSDPHGSMLTNWIGKHDAEIYFRLLDDHQVQQLPIQMPLQDYPTPRHDLLVEPLENPRPSSLFD